MVPFLEEAKKNGAKIVCIDPRETRTSVMSHWHLQPKPGTDSALALGMMNEIVKNNLHDKSFLKKHTSGSDDFIKNELPKYTLSKVSKITGLKQADIKKLAHEYANAKSCLLYTSPSPRDATLSRMPSSA